MNILITVGNVEMLLRSDLRNFELCRRVNRTDVETGKIKQEWVGEKWFVSLEGAFNGLLSMKLKSCDASSLRELKEELEKSRRELLGFYNTTVSLPVNRRRQYSH